MHIRLVVGSMGSAHTGVNIGVAARGDPVFYALHRRLGRPFKLSRAKFACGSGGHQSSMQSIEDQP